VANVTESELNKVRTLVEDCEWIFAKKMPHIPHWYTLRGQAPNEPLFEWFRDVYPRTW
jgi:hypothetical protein